ncbi:hypothetical protein DL546_000126 [Coniochaeta pulveracea]|uniref:Transcription factor domain-containing protein n=1 Tax=Coniochaeta pulveracea TaxID=177199 RepID=A0A420XVX1_9PEZI|nr:hypothetical protein DL546_000126 [Coniochaeta pulveracea]
MGKGNRHDEYTGLPVVPGQPTMSHNHTTTSSLLNWNSVRQLIQHHLQDGENTYNESFPLQQEQKRGVLRLYGHGEDSPHEWADMETSLKQEVAPGVHGNNSYADVSVLTPASSWTPVSGRTRTSAGTLRDSSNSPLLEFSEDKVWMYVQSYEDNIQNMHPLIAPNDLKTYVRQFLDNVQRVESNTRSQLTKRPTSRNTETTRKRPRVSEPSQTSELPGPLVDRSIHSGLVLLILSLGKVCLCRTRIPDPLSASEPITSDNPVVYNAGLSTPMDSCNSNSASLQRLPYQEGGRLPTPAHPKDNMKLIPGLEYFAIATDILGNQLGGTTIKHVYASILAGFYYNQLGRVLEAYSHIHHACCTLSILITPSLSRLSDSRTVQSGEAVPGTSLRDNQLIFAFWTCVQLESDILAELPLPPSPILQYENNIPYPDIRLAKVAGFNDTVILSYTTQVYLRRSLNEVHNTLHDLETSQSGQGRPVPSSKNSLPVIESLLGHFKADQGIPERFRFHRNDPPATDILSARVRAKFWEGRVIILRRFISQILEYNYQCSATTSTVPDPGQIPYNHERSPKRTVSRSTNNAAPDISSYAYAQEGILALIESTKSFHGLKDDQFIVTNVFGTAHAQWGNLLVLSAAYKDPTLGRFIQGDVLRDLFSKTIAFFHTVTHRFSALAIDLRILKGLEKDLFGFRHEE